MSKRTPLNDLHDLIKKHLHKGSTTLEKIAEQIGTDWRSRAEIITGIRDYLCNVGTLPQTDIPHLKEVEELLYLAQGYLTSRTHLI